MTFKAKRYNSYLADAAAAAVNFPQNTPAWDFSGGFPEEYYYINSGDTEAKSCSFLWQGTEDVATLAALSGDPYTISDHPYIASLQVDVVRNSLIENKKLFLFLSLESLTDASGYLQEDPFNSLVQFPELIETQDSFTFTYLHPGDYYVTVVADANGDGYVSLGDITHVSQSITISPETNPTITLDNITVIN
jgi:hypothetical protein